MYAAVSCITMPASSVVLARRAIECGYHGVSPCYTKSDSGYDARHQTQRQFHLSDVETACC